MLGLKPIKTLPIREKIAANLREAILSKKIPAGEILTLESTAQELGVSITPTREAFQILARDGLLELERNKRAVVLGVNEKTIRRDIEELACSYPIETVRGRYGGGVKVLDWYHQNRRTLSPEQAELLKKLAPRLDGHDLEVMNSIISQFAPY